MIKEWLRNFFSLGWAFPALRAEDCERCKGRGFTFLDGSPVPRSHPFDANLIPCLACQERGIIYIPAGEYDD